MHLGPDFEVGPGPKFHVRLVPRSEVTESAHVNVARSADLGRLKAFKGSQNFRVPADIELSTVGSVVIWCAQFGVLISPATLSFEGG